MILTTFARSGYLRRALDAGVLGYLLKDAPGSELLDAVRRVHAGLGRPSAAIATALGIAYGTVKNHLSWAIATLGAANRIEAAHIAHEQGWP